MPETAAIVTREELDTYVHAYEKSGFRGGINWYRNIDRNLREHPEIGVAKLDLPCLMITHCRMGRRACRREWRPECRRFCSDLEMHNIERAGTLGAAGVSRRSQQYNCRLVEASVSEELSRLFRIVEDSRALRSGRSMSARSR